MPAFQPRIGHVPPSHAPAEAPTRERGEYLARSVANCAGCHTKRDPTTFLFTGPEFAGGAEFEPIPGFPGARAGTWFRSPNLTPHPDGVLAKYGSAGAWIARFRGGRVHPSPMHWGAYARMSDADLEAIWVFLRSLEPVASDVGPVVFSRMETP
jgi:hypothetical protein